MVFFPRDCIREDMELLSIESARLEHFQGCHGSAYRFATRSCLARLLSLPVIAASAALRTGLRAETIEAAWQELTKFEDDCPDSVRGIYNIGSGHSASRTIASISFQNFLKERDRVRARSRSNH